MVCNGILPKLTLCSGLLVGLFAGLFTEIGVRHVHAENAATITQPKILIRAFEPDGNTLVSTFALQALFERYTQPDELAGLERVAGDHLHVAALLLGDGVAIDHGKARPSGADRLPPDQLRRLRTECVWEPRQVCTLDI